MRSFGKPATATLAELLERHYNALIQGRLSDLEGMEARIASGLARLSQRGGQAHEMAQIKKLASRNARLLKSAMAGVAQARAQLTQRRSTSLTTYDAMGRTQGHAAPMGRTLARR